MNERKYCVYMHKNKTNEKVYIGITCMKPEHRWESNGKGYANNIHFSRAIAKYGWDGFKHVILHEGLTKEEALQKEIDLISSYDSTNKSKGYNISPGGNLRNEEANKVVSNKLKGHVVKKETREKLRQSSLNYYSSHDNPRKGYVKNDEEKYIDMMVQKSRKSVEQIDLDTGQVINSFNSLGEAARYIGCHYSNIRRVCNGECKQSHGFGWRYADAQSFIYK